jgi:4-amino-4-deoxychorismate lyase
MVDYSHNEHLTTCLVNGVSTDFVSVYDRSIQFGDGIFETILCIDGAPVFWDQHMQRLENAASRLAIGCPDVITIRNDIEQLIRLHERYQQRCVIKIIVTRGTSRRGYKYPPEHHPRRIVTIDDIEPGYSSILSAKLLEGNLCFCNTPVSMNSSLAGLKHLNRLENVLARNELNDDEYIDGVMLDHDDRVIECTMSNIFLVKQASLLTPDLSVSGVSGVVRDMVLGLAGQLGIRTVVGEVTKQAVLESSEMFITNSLIGIKGIGRLDSKIFDQHEVTQRIFDRLLDCLSAK